MEENWDIVIAGGGASGLAAAATIAMNSFRPRTIVLEQSDRLGKKLLATGNGRCNLYNMNLSEQRYTSSSEKALKACIQTIRCQDQLGFWHRLGLLTEVQEEGRVYPSCLQASAVTDTLQRVARSGGIQLCCGQAVSRIDRDGKEFLVSTEAGRRLRAGKVILASGGMAAPRLGASGDGYSLAGRLGHSCTELSPGLVPVRTVNPSKVLRGVRNRAEVSLYDGDQRIRTCRGEVQFTSYGLSGIVMMDLSSCMKTGKTYTVVLDLMPDMSSRELKIFLQQKIRDYPDQRADFLLLGVVKHQLGEVILRACRIDGKKRCLSTLTEEEVEHVIRCLKGWVVRTEGTLSWDEAQITCGGIPLDEVEPDTFQSKLVPGLFLTGELLDAAGDCGGFNLAWAFGTGIAAGVSAAGGD